MFRVNVEILMCVSPLLQNQDKNGVEVYFISNQLRY